MYFFFTLLGWGADPLKISTPGGNKQIISELKENPYIFFFSSHPFPSIPDVMNIVRSVSFILGDRINWQ